MQKRTFLRNLCNLTVRLAYLPLRKFRGTEAARTERFRKVLRHALAVVVQSADTCDAWGGIRTMHRAFKATVAALILAAGYCISLCPRPQSK
jgi:hypothetical protein